MPDSVVYLDPRTLDAESAGMLGALHGDSMPTSLLTRLGPGILERFYTRLDRVPALVAVAARDQDRILGGVVGTSRPDEAFDAVAQPLWRFGAHVLRHRPAMIPQLAWSKLRPAHAIARPPGSVELMYLFTAPNARGRGIGRGLVERFVEAARARGATAVTLSVEVDNAAAIALYERAGFSISAARQREGRVLCHRMTLTLEPADSTMPASS